MRSITSHHRCFYKSLVHASFLILIGVCCSACRAQASIPLSLDMLLSLNADWTQPHEGSPMGVPRDYSWAGRPRMGAGNRHGKYTAVTAWGHAFWSKDTIGHPGELQIRNFSMFICSGPDKIWKRAQYGLIEGAEFRADFKNNKSSRAKYSSSDGVTTVTFDAGNTFHFWPTMGRARLIDNDLCGFLVIFQSRTVALQQSTTPTTGGYLIGAGADYWTDQTAQWDNFKTNTDVGIGRMKRVGPQWTWYGMSTASNDDLMQLFSSAASSAPQ